MTVYRLPAASGTTRGLVVLLHGVGANGQDLIGLAQFWRDLMPDVAFVAPDAPHGYEAAPPGYPGYQWFSLGDWSPASLAAGVEGAHPSVDQLLDAQLAEYGLAGDRLALVGFSQGTMMALHTGLRREPAPAAIVGYSGALLTVPPVRDASPPVLLIHGSADPVVPSAALERTATALSAAGIRVEAVARPQLGHAIDQAGIERAGQFLAQAFAAANPG